MELKQLIEQIAFIEGIKPLTENAYLANNWSLFLFWAVLGLIPVMAISYVQVNLENLNTLQRGFARLLPVSIGVMLIYQLYPTQESERINRQVEILMAVKNIPEVDIRDEIGNIVPNTRIGVKMLELRATIAVDTKLESLKKEYERIEFQNSSKLNNLKLRLIQEAQQAKSAGKATAEQLALLNAKS